ncbi:elongation factor G [Trichothermofontia sp.]
MSENGNRELRNVAIVGPYSSGKTTLLESLLFVTGAISRKGRVQDHNTVGDHTPEARARQMTTEVSVASTAYSGIHFTFLDCPGSIEFAQQTYDVLVGVDAAIVVCEANSERVLTLSPLFKFLDDWEIPHLVFINKLDQVCTDEDRCYVNFNQVLTALKGVSSRPLVPCQYPIGKGSQLVGYIDLITEVAYQYHTGAAADAVPLPPELKEQEQAARSELLETLAEFDDHLLEELLEEVEPPTDEILKDLKQDLSADLVVPVFIGIATEDFGVRPLLQALREETPEPAETAQRRGVPASETTVIAQVLKNSYTPQGGKLSLVRVWCGTLTDGMTLNGLRTGGLYTLMGAQSTSLTTAPAGAIVAISRLEGLTTGTTLSPDSDLTLDKAEPLTPVYALAIAPENRNDEVKLSSALSKLVEEDPSLRWEQHGDTHEVILWGQGDIHLKVALDWLARKYNLPMTANPPQIPYKETIRKSAKDVHGRYKRQSGGHGQFGDVYLDIKPLERGEGFVFSETIVGGVVPKQYIPGVEMGVREYLNQGPLGFPVVDVAVTLTNGSYHSVDSSEQAFKQAARLAMQEGMSRCEPTLLEPILVVTIAVPSDFTASVLRLVSGHRGQILGYEAKKGWKNWDSISAYLPQAEIQNLIVELRSLTLGVGTFNWQYDHLQIVPEKLAEQILQQQA